MTLRRRSFEVVLSVTIIRKVRRLSTKESRLAVLHPGVCYKPNRPLEQRSSRIESTRTSSTVSSRSKFNSLPSAIRDEQPIDGHIRCWIFLSGIAPTRCPRNIWCNCVFRCRLLIYIWSASRVNLIAPRHRLERLGHRAFGGKIPPTTNWFNNWIRTLALNNEIKLLN